MGTAEHKNSEPDRYEVIAPGTLSLDEQKRLIGVIKSRPKDESREAIGTLFSAFYMDVYRLARWKLSHTNSRSIEDDSLELAMDTFETFMEKALCCFEWPTDWRNPKKSPIKEYLFNILNNHCRDLTGDLNEEILFSSGSIDDPEWEENKKLLAEGSKTEYEILYQDQVNYEAMISVFVALDMSEMIPSAPQQPGINLPAELLVVKQAADVKFYKLIAELSLPQKQVLALKYYLDLTAAEIAARLGMKEGTVRQHIKRGLDKLRDQLS